jgi:hypothetical protein
LSNYEPGGAGTNVRVNREGAGETTEDRLAGIAAQALDDQQDFVDEASHEPWPGTQASPRPFAQVRERMLHLWYGRPDPTSPVVLACEPIPLAQVQLSSQTVHSSLTSAGQVDERGLSV